MPIETAPFEGATADPFGDLIPKSGDLEALTPKLDEYGPFHDLANPQSPAPETTVAYDNLVGGATPDAPAHQQAPGGRFDPVPRGVAVSTTDRGNFSDLAGAEPPITNYADQFGSFADLVPPPSPAPKVDEQAAMVEEARHGAQLARTSIEVLTKALSEKWQDESPVRTPMSAAQAEAFDAQAASKGLSAIKPGVAFDKLKEFTDYLAPGVIDQLYDSLSVFEIPTEFAKQTLEAAQGPGALINKILPIVPERVSKGLTQAAAEQIHSLSTPDNVLALGAMALLPGTGAAKIFSRAISLGFGAQAAYGMVNSIKAAANEKDPQAFWKDVGDAVFLGGIGSLAILHGARGGKENAIQEPSTAGEVPRVSPPGENVPGDTGRVGESDTTGQTPGEAPPAEPQVPPAAPPETELAPPVTREITAPATPEEKAARIQTLRPALRTEVGDIPGEKGQTHADIIKANPETTVLDTEPEHGFVDEAGNFYTRAEASTHLGETEPLQSERLRELQAPSAEAPPAEPAPPAPPSEEASAGPKPNKNGVYESDQAEVIEYKPTKKAHRETASVRLLEIKPGVWISAVDFQTSVEGMRSPLSDNSRQYGSREDALRGALGELGDKFQRGIARPDNAKSHAEQLGRLKSWVDSLSQPETGGGGTETVVSPQGETTAPPSKLKMTYEEFLDAPREGPLLDALRTLPKRVETEGEVKARARVDTLSEKISKAGLNYVIETGNKSGLSKVKAKLIDDYNKAWNDLHAETKAANPQRYLYDKAVESGLIEDPNKIAKEEPVQGTVIAPEAPVTSAAEAGVPPKVEGGTVSVGSPPLKPLPPTSVKTPKSIRQIIEDLSKGLDVPIRFKRLLSQKYAGYFLPRANLIVSKLASSLPIVTHEAGHKFDREFKMSSDKSIQPELDVLGDPATRGSMSSWTKSKSKSYKMGEGVAEFIRYWLTDPQHAEQVAPNAAKLFESLLDANKDMGDVLRQAQNDIDTLRSADYQMRIRSQVSVGENPNKTPYTLQQLTRDLVDDLHFIRLPFEELAKRTGKILPSENAYVLARNLRGTYGMASTWIRDGVVDFKTRKVTLGTSFEDALKPVGGRLADFRDWIIAKQAKEMMSKGQDTGLRMDDVLQTVKRFEQDKDFQKAFADIKIWRTHLIKYLVDSGALSAKSAVSMLKMWQDYVPLHRIFEVGAGEPPSQEGTGGRGLNVGKPGSLRPRRGGDRPIADPFETYVKDAYTLVTMAEKTAINHAVADLANKPEMGRWVEKVPAPKEMVQVGLGKIRDALEASGADLSNVDEDLLLSFYRNGRQAPFGENIIRIMRNDKPEFYRLNKDLFDTFNALDLEDNGRLIRMMAVPGNILRSGVILEPSFAIANILKDNLSSAVISKYGAVPFEAAIRGTFALLKNPELVARWRASGGANAIELNYFDRNAVQDYIRDRITKDMSAADRATVVSKSPLTALRYITAFSEEATRIGEFQIVFNHLRKGGMPEGEASRLAAFESRDRQDFAKGGAKTKIPRALTPFWNAALQANVKLVQSFRERPIRTILQGAAWITIPKMIEQAVNWDDKDYWDRPQWERDLFFLIPIGKDSTGHTRFFRIPTPFEQGVLFGTLPGRVMQSLHEHAPDAMKSFPSFFLGQSVPNPIPQAGQVVIEDALTGPQGWDLYRGRPIVPDSIAEKPPEMQWTEQTSALAKKIGQTIGVSPMKVDHIIASTTGGMGKLLTGYTAPGKRFITTPLRSSSQTMENFYTKLHQLTAESDRVKAGTSTADVSALQDMQRAAREMGELRTLSRMTPDKETREQLDEQIYQIARGALNPP